MKILQVIPSLNPVFGGPTNATIGFSRALARQGQEVTIFTTDAGVNKSSDSPFHTPINIQNVKTCYFPVRYLKHYKFSLPLAKALRDSIPYFDVVHIHSLFQFSTLVASYFCQKYHKPYLIRPLGHLDPYVLRRHAFYKYLYLSLFERKNLERAYALHFTSEEERKGSGLLGFKVRSIVIPLGIDLEEFYNLPLHGTFRSKYPELRDKKIILFLSRINFKKGLDILVKAFAILAKERDDIRLVIAGPDNEGYGRKVKKWLSKEGALNKTIFTGMLLGRDKLAALSDSDIFVLPSYSENFGLAVVEAMACGLPVVISNKVNIFSDIKEAGAGLVVETDPMQLFVAMKKMLEEPGLRKELGDRARALVERKFNWEDVTPQLIKVYESMLESAAL